MCGCDLDISNRCCNLKFKTVIDGIEKTGKQALNKLLLEGDQNTLYESE